MQNISTRLQASAFNPPTYRQVSVVAQLRPGRFPSSLKLLDSKSRALFEKFEKTQVRDTGLTPTVVKHDIAAGANRAARIRPPRTIDGACRLIYGR